MINDSNLFASFAIHSDNHNETEVNQPIANSQIQKTIVPIMNDKSIISQRAEVIRKDDIEEIRTETKIELFKFYEIVVKAEQHNYLTLRNTTLNNFIFTIKNSNTPSECRDKLGIIQENDEEDTWENIKNSFNGYWHKNCFIKLTKVSKPIDDYLVSTCYKCNSIFTYLNRK